MIKPRLFESLVFLGIWCGGIWSGNLVRGDWAQFRGPGGNGVSEAADVPSTWSATEGVVWRTPLPGLGASSPIVVGQRVLVTCYSGYAETIESAGKLENLVRHVVCMDTKSGQLLWHHTVAADQPESKYEGGNNTWHGYSASTPASDGVNVYAFLGKSGVHAYRLDGTPLWHTSVGDGVTGWGSGASPVLCNDLLVVNASVESRSLVALDKSTGQEKWRVDRKSLSADFDQTSLASEEKWRTQGIRGCWNTPLRVVLENGKSELVLSLPTKVLAIDSETGGELWTCDGISDEGYVCPSLVTHAGIVYCIGGRKNEALAIRAGGRGDVSGTHVLWRTNKGANVSSPVYLNGCLYWVHEGRGELYCLDARTGNVQFQQRLEPRPGTMYPSLVAADGRLYAASQHKGVFVFAAKRQYELLAHNVFADDDSRMNASLAIDGGRIYLRNDKFLYCLGSNGQ
jgi:outer membrane protein assembly factor BamB